MHHLTTALTPSGLAQVANVLLAYRGKNNLGGPARAAEDIARETARDLLGPLLDCACSRLSFVIRRVFDIAADRAMGKTNGRDNLQPYVAFHAALRAAHQNFVNKLEGQVRLLARSWCVHRASWTPSSPTISASQQQSLQEASALL